MESKEAYDVTSRATPEPEVMVGQSHDVSNGDGGIKRDLSSRHINMIAIAGMIVSQGTYCGGMIQT